MQWYHSIQSPVDSAWDDRLRLLLNIFLIGLSALILLVAFPFLGLRPRLISSALTALSNSLPHLGLSAEGAPLIDVELDCAFCRTFGARFNAIHYPGLTAGPIS